MIKFENIVVLVEASLKETPIPFRNIHMDPQEILGITVRNVWENYQTNIKMLNRSEADEMMLSVLTKVIMENFYLWQRNTKLENDNEKS